MLRVCDAVFAGTEESVTVTPKVDVAAGVGVPLKTPLPTRLRPSGSVPLETTKLYGGVPPEATREGVYAVPVKAVGKVCGAKTSGETDAVTVRVKLPLVVLFWG